VVAGGLPARNVFVNTFMTTLPLFSFSNTSFVQGGVDFSRRGRHVNDHFAMLVNSMQKFLEGQHTNHSLESNTVAITIHFMYKHNMYN
jgi:hypothetical protein